MPRAKAKTKPEAPASIPERIAAANENIAALREERAEALIAGKDFDQSRLSAAEVELEALEDAQAAQHRQAQEAARETAEKEAAKARKEVLALEARRTGHVEQAEAFARSMVAELEAAETARAEIEARFKRLGLSGAPGWLDQAVRLSRSVSAVLTKLTDRGSGVRWGDVKLHRGLCRPEDAWLKQEEPVTSRIQQALEPSMEKRNG